MFAAHNIGYFFYNGGGDSQDTAYKVSQLSTAMGFPVDEPLVGGAPKVDDNDCYPSPGRADGAVP